MASYKELKEEVVATLLAKKEAFAELKKAKEEQAKAYCKNDAVFEEKKLLQAKLEAEWNAMQTARDAMTAEANRGKDSYEKLNSEREKLSREIKKARANSNKLYKAMRDSFERAGLAFKTGDKKSSASYVAEGHKLKEDLEKANEQVKSLTEQMKNLGSVSDNYSVYKTAYDSVKKSYNKIFKELKALPDGKKLVAEAKAKKAEAEAKFEKAEALHVEARAKVEEFLANQNKQNEKNWELMRKAGVPKEFWRTCEVKKSKDKSSTNFYFGGIGESNELWHGHIVIDNNGVVVYRRMPGVPRGSHNYLK